MALGLLKPLALETKAVLLFFKKKDPLAGLKAAIDAQDEIKTREAIAKIIATHGYKNEVTHQAMVILQRIPLPPLDILQNYVASDPNLICSAQLRVAQVRAQMGDPDGATTEGRNLLRRLLTSQLVGAAAPESAWQTLAAQAYLVTTAVYTFAGARSYSLRLLRRALDLPMKADSKSFLEAEIENVRGEMTEPANAALDEKWERFFATCRDATELIDLCNSRGFEMLARRLDLLETNARFKAEFKCDEHEILLEVMQFGPGADGKLSQYLG